MANPRPFGRKGQSRRVARSAPAAAPFRDEAVPQAAPPPAPAAPRPFEIAEEPLAWKQTRKRQIPWGPLSLMASLCFGIASFELPDSVNGVANLLLYALSAMSLWVWFSKRRQRMRAKAQEPQAQ